MKASSSKDNEPDNRQSWAREGNDIANDNITLRGSSLIKEEGNGAFGPFSSLRSDC